MAELSTRTFLSVPECEEYSALSGLEAPPEDSTAISVYRRFSTGSNTTTSLPIGFGVALIDGLLAGLVLFSSPLVMRETPHHNLLL